MNNEQAAAEAAPIEIGLEGQRNWLILLLSGSRCGGPPDSRGDRRAFWVG
jgi:hypothetical protein